MEEQNILESYEIKNWEFNPRIYKILGLSVIINALMIFGLGQSNLLHSRACDGPLVGKVCQVLDTLYVGSKLFSGDQGYVVKDYRQTHIDDADVVWVDQTGEEPRFTYPEGYFYKEDQETEEFPGEDPVTFNGSENPPNIMPPSNNTPFTISPPPSRGGGLIGKRPVLPKRNKKPVSGDLPPELITRDGDNATTKKSKNGSPSKLPKLGGDNKDNTEKKEEPKKNPLENNTAKTSKSVNDIEINKKPLYDFADEILVKWEKKEVDLSKQFLVRMQGEIAKNGRLNRKRSQFVDQKGDEEMINVAKRAIESVGDSGWLDYLSRFDVKKVNMVFAQNDAQLLAAVDSSLPTPEKASSVASGLKSAIQLALFAHNNGVKKLKDDEVTLLKAANISSKGKLLKINFNLPKQIAQSMIDGRLKEYQAKKRKEKGTAKPDPSAKPNGTAEKSDTNKNSAK